jgi:hypothetical protein
MHKYIPNSKNPFLTEDYSPKKKRTFLFLLMAVATLIPSTYFLPFDDYTKGYLIIAVFITFLVSTVFYVVREYNRGMEWEDERASQQKVTAIAEQKIRCIGKAKEDEMGLELAALKRTRKAAKQSKKLGESDLSKAELYRMKLEIIELKRQYYDNMELAAQKELSDLDELSSKLEMDNKHREPKE